MENTKAEKIPMCMLCFTIIVFILSEYSQSFLFLEIIKIKHFLIIFDILFLGSILVKKNKNKNKFELINVLKGGMALFIISLLFQLYYFSFKIFTLREMYYLVVPVIFVWISYNYLSKKNLHKIFNVFFYTATFAFFIKTYKYLSIRNFIDVIKNISISGLNSPFETGLADIFAPLLIYYLYKNDKLKIFLCVFLGILSSKRQATIFIIFIIILYNFIPRNKKVNKLLTTGAVIFFTIMPIFISFCSTTEFSAWFYNKFSITLSEFSMTRTDIINTVKEANLTNYGLGTVTNFLEKRNVPGQTNMHSDLLRIYMECTIVGTFLYIRYYFEIAKKNYMSFILMMYFFFGLAINHYISPGSTPFLILLFDLIFYFNNESTSKKQYKSKFIMKEINEEK